MNALLISGSQVRALLGSPLFSIKLRASGSDWTPADSLSAGLACLPYPLLTNKIKTTAASPVNIDLPRCREMETRAVIFAELGQSRTRNKGITLSLLDPRDAISWLWKPDEDFRIVTGNDQVRARSDLLHSILGFQI